MSEPDPQKNQKEGLPDSPSDFSEGLVLRLSATCHSNVGVLKLMCGHNGIA